jgi:hypothetical protein
MPIESATYVSDFQPTLPGASDLESEGDDHLRLIKSVLQSTFPRTAKALYFPTSQKTTGNYSVSYPSDQNTLQFIDATGGVATVTLPNPTGVNADGWTVRIAKFDSSANAVNISPGANNINGSASAYALNFQWEMATLVWSTSFNGWILLDSMVPLATNSVPGRIQIATQAQAGTGTDNTTAVSPLALYQPEQTLASAGTIDLSVATSENILVTGNTGPITSFGVAAAGIRRKLRFSGTPTITYNAASMILPGSANIAIQAGDNLEAFSLGAGNWVVRWIGHLVNVGGVTVTKLTSGTSTYTPPAGCLKVRVRMCGSGAGGSSTNAVNVGGAGNQSSYGAWTALGGGAPSGNVGGVGGTGGVNGTGVLVDRIQGGDGATGPGLGTATVNINAPGGRGGTNPFGGAGSNNYGGAGGVGKPNTGAGGSGGGMAGNNSNAGAGGGAGEYVEFWVINPVAVTYVVGAAGTGGSGSGNAGGNGAAGVIVIEEFYS